MLKRGDTIGIVACSNALDPAQKETIETLDQILTRLGLAAVYSDYIYKEPSECFGFAATPERRAEALMRFYRDSQIRAIFDISGGDAANQILPYLDYAEIKRHAKPFWGYSDLTVLINALYQTIGRPSYLYQLKNLVWDQSGRQTEAFQNTVFNESGSLYQIRWRFLQGERMEGVVVGGNARCFLKLAGTPYFPDLRGKLLFLESRSGGAAQIATYLCQLSQMEVFDQIAGLLLGTFTELEEAGGAAQVERLLSFAVPPGLPVAKTGDVGHSALSKCLIIGKNYLIE